MERVREFTLQCVLFIFCHHRCICQPSPSLQVIKSYLAHEASSKRIAATIRGLDPDSIDVSHLSGPDTTSHVEDVARSILYHYAAGGDQAELDRLILHASNKRATTRASRMPITTTTGAATDGTRDDDDDGTTASSVVELETDDHTDASGKRNSRGRFRREAVTGPYARERTPSAAAPTGRRYTAIDAKVVTPRPETKVNIEMTELGQDDRQTFV